MLKPIKDKRQYEDYLERAYELMQQELKPNSEESDELEVISILIENYEKSEFLIDSPTPIEAILFRIDQLGMKKSELTKIIGSRSRTSEILNGKRKLSLAMIRKLNQKLKIPAEVLIRDYEIEQAR